MGNAPRVFIAGMLSGLGFLFCLYLFQNIGWTGLISGFWLVTIGAILALLGHE